MIRIRCDRANAYLQETETLTAGMVNLPTVQFTFSEDWDGYGKTAVVRAGNVRVEVLLIEDAITVPAECLEVAGVNLIIGVYGADSTHELPTVWCACGEILDGTDINSAINHVEATHSNVDQMLEYAASIEAYAEDLDENVIREAEAVDTNANQYGTAHVNVTDDHDPDNRKLTFTFTNLKGNGIEALNIIDDEEDPNYGKLQIRQSNGTIQNFSGLKDAIDSIDGLEEDIESAEAARVIAETGRTTAEATRVTNESDRNRAEGVREQNEAARAAAEEDRVKLFDHVSEMTADAETLAAGSYATAEKQVDSSGNINFHFGIPKGDKGTKGDKGNKGDKGDKGDTGAVPDFSIGTVTTGAPGTNASATITGTDAAPVLNLTIPRGNTGEISEAQFNPVKNAVSKNGTYIIAPGTGDSSAILNSISGTNANTASGTYSFAEGYNTAAEGSSSHAEGYGTVAKQFGDHSEGCQTEADSKVGGGYVSGAHAEGIYTKANNTAAHAEGNSTTASGENSHAEGKNTVASKKSQHVFGEYNIAETGYGFSRGTYVEIVGNGTSNNAKSNARTLDWSGNEVLAGNLTAAGGSITVGQTTFTENQLSAVNEVEDLKSSIGDVEDYALKAYATDTASGAIATLHDGAEDIPIKSLSVAIEPVQDLHGYENPWPAGGGKNLLNPSGTTQTINGVTFTMNADGTVVANGTATAEARFTVGTYTLKAGTAIKYNGSIGGSASTYCVAYSGYQNCYDGDITADRTSGSSDWENAPFFVIVFEGASVSNKVFYPMIRLATEADDTFAPYSNICPISGHTECNVTRTGKNLYAGTNATDYTVIYGGKNNSTSPVNEDYTFKPGTYRISFDIDGFVSSPSMFFSYKVGGVWTSPTNKGQVTTFTFTVPENCEHFEIWGYGGTYTGFKNVQIEVGSTATDYEPYRGTTYPITFPSGTTVYGGNITVNQDGSGSLVVDRTEETFDGSQDESIQYGSSGMTFLLKVKGDIKESTSQTSVSGIISNYLKEVIQAGTWGVNGTFSRVFQNKDRIYIKINDALTDIDELKTYLSSNPLSFVYKLATPITIPLTAEQIGVITSLYGVNNFWADTGDVDVTIRADTALYIAKKIAEALNA